LLPFYYPILPSPTDMAAVCPSHKPRKSVCHILGTRFVALLLCFTTIPRTLAIGGVQRFALLSNKSSQTAAELSKDSSTSPYLGLGIENLVDEAAKVGDGGNVNDLLGGSIKGIEALLKGASKSAGSKPTPSARSKGKAGQNRTYHHAHSGGFASKMGRQTVRHRPASTARKIATRAKHHRRTYKSGKLDASSKDSRAKAFAARSQLDGTSGKAELEASGISAEVSSDFHFRWPFILPDVESLLPPEETIGGSFDMNQFGEEDVPFMKFKHLLEWGKDQTPHICKDCAIPTYKDMEDVIDGLEKDSDFPRRRSNLPADSYDPNNSGAI